MKKICVLIAIISICVLVGCGNDAKHVNEQNMATTTNNARAEETETINAELIENSEKEDIPTAENNSEINAQAYIGSDGVFNMDKYVETLGYSVIKADKSHSWYLIDSGQHHYCIVAYRDTLNIMFDHDNAGYGINVVDNYDLHERTEPQRIQSDTFDVSKVWIEEAADLLKYVAEEGPSDQEVFNYPGVKSLPLTCTKNSGNLVVDERGVYVGASGSAELFWKKNW